MAAKSLTKPHCASRFPAKKTNTLVSLLILLTALLIVPGLSQPIPATFQESLCFLGATDLGYALHCSQENATNFAFQTQAQISGIGNYSSGNLVSSEDGRFGYALLKSDSGLLPIRIDMTLNQSLALPFQPFPAQRFPIFSKKPKALFHPGIPYTALNESLRFCLPSISQGFQVLCGSNQSVSAWIPQANLTSIDYAVDRMDPTRVLIAYSNKREFVFTSVKVFGSNSPSGLIQTSLSSVPFDDTKVAVSPQSDWVCGAGISLTSNSTNLSFLLTCRGTNSSSLTTSIANLTLAAPITAYDVFFSKNGSLICYWVQVGSSLFELHAKCISPSNSSAPGNEELVFFNVIDFAIETSPQPDGDRVMLLLVNDYDKFWITRDTFLFGSDYFHYQWYTGNGSALEIALTTSPHHHWFALATTQYNGSLGASDMWTATGPFALRQFKAASDNFTTYSDMHLAFSPFGHLCRFSRVDSQWRVECHVKYILSNNTNETRQYGSYQFDTTLNLPGNGTPAKSFFESERFSRGTLSPLSCPSTPLRVTALCFLGTWNYQGNLTLETSNIVLGSTSVNGSLTVNPSVLLNISRPLNVSEFIDLSLNSTLQISAPISIGGNLIIASNSTIEFTPGNPLAVGGCLTLNDTTLILNNVTHSELIHIADFTCGDPKFVRVETRPYDPCDTVKATQTSSSTQLFVAITVNKGAKCVVKNQLSLGAIIGIVVAVVVVVVLVVTIIFAVPAIRLRVFPHRHRKSFVPTDSLLSK